MPQQVQFGRDPIQFEKEDKSSGIICPGLQVTPTPSPTIACLSVNLKTIVDCKGYEVVDAYKSTSIDKINSTILLSDNSIVSCGSSVCSSILNDTHISESTIIKTKLNSLNIDGVLSRKFVLDNTFNNNGKINTAYYDSNNLKVNSKFSTITRQVSSGQNRILAAGVNNNKPLIARFLSSNGNVDRTFGFGTGFVSFEFIKNETIRLISVFGLLVQTDNRIVVFCNAYDLINKRSIIVILRLTNSGSLDTSFANNQGYIELRSELPEFDGNKILGKNIYRNNNAIYIVFESFSSLKNNTIILAKYNIETSQVNKDFGLDGYKYINFDNKNTFFHSLIFLNNNDQTNIYIICNQENKQLHVFGIYETLDDSKTTQELLTTIPENIFKINNEFDSTIQQELIVKFLDISVNSMLIDNQILIPINLQILSNPVNVLGTEEKTFFHWLENQSLVEGKFNFSRVLYRDCIISPCDRQPEDSYATLNVTNQLINKYNTSSRILFGYIIFDTSNKTVSSIRLDRFESTSVHNIIKNIIRLEDTYIACGYGGDNNYSNLMFKTISLLTNTSSLGPSSNDTVGVFNFDNTCSELIPDALVLEECPCAPLSTPTPTPTPINPTADVYAVAITSKCIGDTPTLSVNWQKSRETIQGSYVLQVVRNTSEKPEILASIFNVARNINESTIDLSLVNIDSSLNNKTCLINILDNSGVIIYSQIFVLNIPSCL
jgi:hypothetical protein